MAPEVARKIEVKRITEKADIFSLGCILYYILTGNEAFGGKEKDEDALSKKIKNLQSKVDTSYP
jgi:serine/threonine protein kinase